MNTFQLPVCPCTVHYNLCLIAFHQWCDQQEAMSDARQCTEECTMGTPPTSPVHTPLCTPPTTPPPSPRRLTADKRVPVPWAQQEAALLDTVERAQAPPPAPPAPPPAPKQQRVFTMGTVYTVTDPYDSTSQWLCMKRTKCFVWLKEVHEHHHLKDIYKRKIMTNQHGEHCSIDQYRCPSAQNVTAASSRSTSGVTSRRR